MNIVWDFGGVLFRWRPPALIARTLPHHAPTAEAAQAAAAAFFQSDGGDWHDFDRGTLDVDTLVERTVRRLGWSRDDVQAVVDAVPGELQPIPDAVELLRTQRDAGHRLFYLSNMPAPYADRLEHDHDFLGWFEAGVFSSRVRLIKPDAAIFDAAEARFGLPAQELIFIDDHPANVEAARRKGWQALQVIDPAQVAEDLKGLGA